MGSETVFVNGNPVARKGDKTTCDAAISDGSPNVFFGSGQGLYAEIEPEFSTAQQVFITAVEMAFPPSKGAMKSGLGKIRLGIGTVNDALKDAIKVSRRNKNAILPKQKLKAGSPEHKAQRWKEYQTKPSNKSKWNYERWSKQYDTNMRNAKYGLEREKHYREKFGGKSETIKTKLTYRQIDISKGKSLQQLKTGKVSLTKQAKIDIQKDILVIRKGYKVEYILEKGASKPFLKALEDNGIKYTIGSKL